VGFLIIANLAHLYEGDTTGEEGDKNIFLLAYAVRIAEERHLINDNDDDFNK
jgi:hypothetical protein